MKTYGKAEEAVENIVKAFRNPATLPAPLAQVFVQQNDGSPCRKWSWRNQLIVAVRGHREARGFRQWEQVGRKVTKGEKAFYILSPVVKESEDEEGKKQKIVYGFRGTAVFGYAQTEGKPLHEIGPSAWIESLPLIEVAKSWGLWVDAIQGGGGVLGSYCVGKGIALRVRNLSTWAHELVHAADDRNGKLSGSPKWQKEVVAELGGAVLLCALGFEHAADLGGCWEYIQNYANERQVEIIDICGEMLERTCEAVSLILDTAEQIQADSLVGSAVGGDGGGNRETETFSTSCRENHKDITT